MKTLKMINVSYFAVKDPYELMDVDTRETLAVLQQVKDRK